MTFAEDGFAVVDVEFECAEHAVGLGRFFVLGAHAWEVGDLTFVVSIS